MTNDVDISSLKEPSIPLSKKPPAENSTLWSMGAMFCASLAAEAKALASPLMMSPRESPS